LLGCVSAETTILKGYPKTIASNKSVWPGACRLVDVTNYVPEHYSRSATRTCAVTRSGTTDADSDIGIFVGKIIKRHDTTRRGKQYGWMVIICRTVR
jgi:hypothetical protein